MTLDDIDQVLAIERCAFPSPWSERAFVSEITENAMAHYVVVERAGVVVAYSGMWLILDEAHITNIAVHSRVRRQGVGGFLLSQMLARAAARGCQRMTLEVRVSNSAAQLMYHRFGFQRKGVRRGYYTDTREDAIIMWKDDIHLLIPTRQLTP
ncbi:MAG: ribosomal protein S18-alanine N-acetyltransferase [Bacillota bacterium]|jgi:ribosomal-protein-alanine N-acetyltransferase